MTTPILLALQPLPLVDATIEAHADGEVALLTAAGYVSVQPDGTVETRTAVGLWERATRIGPNLVRYDGAGYVQYFFVQETTPVPPPVPPAPPGPPPVVWDVSADLDFNASIANQQAFIERWTLMAYGAIKEGIVAYWLLEARGLLARGAVLGLVPPARYFLERIIGRGSGGDDIARYGPYAGLSEDQTSRTPWQASE
jgi:hypothetical protein